MKDINIGLLGFGTIGTGVVKLLAGNGLLIEEKLGARLYLKRIADLDITTDRGVPVAAGVRGPDTDHFSQAAYARREPERQYPDGVAFLLDQIRAHPGQVTVIAIGALTNLRAALERVLKTKLNGGV